MSHTLSILKVVSYYTVCSLAPLRHVPIVYRSDVAIHEEALFLLTSRVRFKSLLPKIDSTLPPYWCSLDFCKINLEKSCSTNWIFSACVACKNLIRNWFLQAKNPVRNRLKIQFIELNFSKLIFQKSSADQQRVCRDKH